VKGSLAEEFAERFVDAYGHARVARGRGREPYSLDKLEGAEREAVVDACEEMLRTWVIWCPSGRGVGVQIREADTERASGAGKRGLAG
jgi:hypothetical protein